VENSNNSVKELCFKKQDAAADKLILISIFLENLMANMPGDYQSNDLIMMVKVLLQPKCFTR
jgi:hypothetical protein